MPLLRKLHIGGQCRRDGWEVLNAQPGPEVDHVCNANDLSTFSSSSFSALYASHVLEHFDYVREIDVVLTEWFRVLKPGGQLFISVPDLETLARLFLDTENLNEEERFHITRMIFGGHTDAYDYHQSGISEAILRRYLQHAGFVDITRVERFGLFDDTSNLEFKGIPISLNIQAIRPHSPGSDAASLPPNNALPIPPTSTDTTHPAPTEPVVRPGAAWDHGYFSGGAYTSGFYVEMSPHRLDFSALVNGHRSPRPQPGAAFRYLELGCGMGFGLCLLAAAHPEGEFVGVDFVPDHIAHSQWLAKALQLTNIRFLEADFLDLQVDPEPLDVLEPKGGSGFHYVVAHGIATWVSAPVQQALLTVAAKQLLPGGLFYCSYNTYPGWLGRSSFHMLASLKRQFEHPVAPLKAFAEACSTLKALAGYGQPLGRSLPQLVSSLEFFGARSNTAYLLGEFPSTWAPLYVADMHGRCLEHKLTYLATASLPELFEELLPGPLRAVVSAEANPTLRQAVLDLAINQSFRRDIFVKGLLPLSKHQRELALAQLLIIKGEASNASGIRCATSVGELELDANFLSAIESVLTEGPCAIGDLCLALGMAVDALLPSLALLINSSRIELHRGDIAAAAISRGIEVNRRLRDLMQEGHAYGYLVAPAVSSAVGFTPLQALVLEAIEQNLDEDIAISCVLMGLESIGAYLNDASGHPITDPQGQVQALRSYLEEFRSIQLPLLRRIGAIP